MPGMRRRQDDDEQDERYEDEEPRRSRRSRDEDQDDQPRRGRSRGSSHLEDDEHEPRRSRSRSRRDEDQDDEPPRRRSRSRNSRDDEDEEPRSRAGRRSRSRGDGERGGRAAKGFDSFSQKRAKTSNYADEFKPKDNTPTLIKFLDPEPFDNYNQHWVDDVKKGDPKSYMCYDDEYHPDFEEQGCPLCDIGEPAKTYSLFNVLDLTNPNKPENKVWVTSPAVTDILERMSTNNRTSPLDRDDLYFEVEKVVKKKTTWNIEPVKARDLEEDFDIPPFEADEIESFLEKRFTDRKGVVRVDDWDRLDEVAEYVTS